MTWLLSIWKSDLSDKIKLEFYQTEAMSVLLYGSTIWNLMKHLEKKARWEQHKNAMCCFEQVLEATLCKKTSCTTTYLSSHKSFKLDKHQLSGDTGCSLEDLPKWWMIGMDVERESK